VAVLIISGGGELEGIDYRDGQVVGMAVCETEELNHTFPEK